MDTLACPKATFLLFADAFRSIIRTKAVLPLLQACMRSVLPKRASPPLCIRAVPFQVTYLESRHGQHWLVVDDVEVRVEPGHMLYAHHERHIEADSHLAHRGVTPNSQAREAHPCHSVCPGHQHVLQDNLRFPYSHR